MPLRATKVLFAEPGQILTAMRPEETAEAFHVHGEHGHSEFLAPDPGLMRLPRRPEAVDFGSPRVGELPKITEHGRDQPGDPQGDPADPAELCLGHGFLYASDLDRYTGVTALDTQGPSHVAAFGASDNKRVEAQLMRDLRAMGYCPTRHDFMPGRRIRASSPICPGWGGSGSSRISWSAIARSCAIRCRARCGRCWTSCLPLSRDWMPAFAVRRDALTATGVWFG
ncbi:MAG: hypothetical protein R3D85_14400 [Paracoccaceae bacterium]